MQRRKKETQESGYGTQIHRKFKANLGNLVELRLKIKIKTSWKMELSGRVLAYHMVLALIPSNERRKFLLSFNSTELNSSHA